MNPLRSDQHSPDSIFLASSNRTVENLQFLTIDQILADLANLVVKVKSDLDAPFARIIVYGERIGGTVAVLGRKKFPHLIDAAWSSSSIFRTTVFDQSYYNSIAWVLYWIGSDECANRLSLAHSEVSQLISSGNASELQRLFDTTAPLDFSDSQEVIFFWETLFNFVSNYVENNQ